MKTIQSIYRILSEFASRQEAISAKERTAYEEKSNTLRSEVKEQLMLLRNCNPEYAQFDLHEIASGENAGHIAERIRANAQQRIAAEILPTGDYFCDNVQGNIIYTPKFAGWQQDGDQGHNFVLSFSGTEKELADRFMNGLLFNMLISLPAKAVHLSFVDLSLSGGYEMFTRSLPSSICGKTVMGNREFGDLLSSLIDRMRDALQKYGDVVRYNMQEKTVSIPYEVVVLVNYPNNFNSYMDDLLSLFENGHKGGIYFVVMNNTDIQVEDRSRQLLSMKDRYQEIKVKDVSGCTGMVSPTPVFHLAALQKELLAKLNEEASQKKEEPSLDSNYDKLVSAPFEPIDSTLSVPVGRTSNGEEVMFRLSTSGHIHSFILGQSGSGKSVFLHDVITAAIAKYSPEELYLYLLDFKLGGVELNRYRNEKHVKALLVDNSDIQITLEILRDLSEQMRERGKLLRSSNVDNITDYNRNNPSARMPRILLIADECHVMFNTQDQKQRKYYDEISSIITKIAKEGRNQGVHLVLATQTLAQTNISDEIRNNISDHYLLKCASTDSERMVDGSSKITSNLTTGEVYYHGRDDNALFKAYFVKREEGDKLVEAINEKTKDYDTGEQFYFVGSQVYEINAEVEASLCSYKGNYPVAALGRSMDISQSSVNIPLRNDDAENIMIFGIDEVDQVTGTSLSILKSMMISTKGRDIGCRYMIMDFLGKDTFRDGVRDVEGDVEFIGKRDCGKTLYELCEDIDTKRVRPTVLMILGQEKFRDLKFDNDIEDIPKETSDEPTDDFGFGSAFLESPKDRKKYDTYRKALAYILDYGGEAGVHVVLQIDKPDKFLFDDNFRSKTVFQKFKHLVMLRSDANSVVRLDLSDDVAPESLSSDLERLRAIYYNESNDSYTLFTPYRSL